MPLVVKWHIRKLLTIYFLWAGVCLLVPTGKLIRETLSTARIRDTAYLASHYIDGIPIPDLIFESADWIFNPLALVSIFIVYAMCVVLRERKSELLPNPFPMIGRVEQKRKTAKQT